MPRVRDEKSFQQKRQQILAAATQCFIESGFHGAGMAKICQAAEMSAGALYRYFPSKESMIEAIVDQDRIEAGFFMERLKQSENKAIGLADAMEKAVHLFAEGRSNCQLWVEIAAEASRNPVAAKLVADADADLLAEIETVIKQGQAADQINRALVPMVTAQLLVTMADGFMGLFAMRREVVEVDAIAQQAQQMVLQLLKA